MTPASGSGRLSAGRPSGPANLSTEFAGWREELAGARLAGQRWVRPTRSLSWLVAIAIAVLAGPGVFTAALFLTKILGAAR